MTTTMTPNHFADTFGYPKGRAVTKLRDYMTAYVQEFIQHAPFVIMATSDSDGRCDTSPKGGKPGFVRVLDERHLLFPDVADGAAKSFTRTSSAPAAASGPAH